MKTKKYFLLGLLTFGLSLSACTPKTQLNTTNQNENSTVAHADWQELSFEKQKFSLHYPSNWNFKPEIERDNLLTGSLVLTDETQEKTKNLVTNEMFTPEYMINIRVEDNPDNLSASDFAVKQYLPQSRDKMKAKLTETKIAGQIATIDSGPTTPPGSGPYTEFIFAPKNNKAYYFTYWPAAHEETTDKYLEEFKKVLATLKFY